jgi:hypothetical protein
MKFFLLSLLLFAARAFAQNSELPDHPTPDATTCTQNNGKPCPKWLHKLVGQHPLKHTDFYNPALDSGELSWHDTFFSRSAIPLWAAAGVSAASVIGDERDTLIGQSRGCYERGKFGPYKVSLGRMGSVDWPTWFGINAFSFTLRKLRIPIAPYAGPLTFAAKHSLGMAHWHQTKCL